MGGQQRAPLATALAVTVRFTQVGDVMTVDVATASERTPYPLPAGQTRSAAILRH